jgi:hypothetical protein
LNYPRRALAPQAGGSAVLPDDFRQGARLPHPIGHLARRRSTAAKAEFGVERHQAGVQAGRLLGGKGCNAIDPEAFQHVRKDRAHAIDPGKVGAPRQPPEDRLVNPGAGGERLPTRGWARGRQQLIRVRDALTP